jgi:hypothetical protein
MSGWVTIRSWSENTAPTSADAEREVIPAGQCGRGGRAAGEQAVGPSRRKGRDGQPERVTDLLRRVDQSRNEAGVARCDPRHRERRQRWERQTGADPGQQHHRQDAADVVPVHWYPREEQ